MTDLEKIELALYRAAEDLFQGFPEVAACFKVLANRIAEDEAERRSANAREDKNKDQRI